MTPKRRGPFAVVWCKSCGANLIQSEAVIDFLNLDEITLKCRVCGASGTITMPPTPLAAKEEGWE